MTKKKQILTTTLKLFVTQGFQNTPTSLIAKNAKVSTGTLFYYFPTKEKLIHTIYLEAKDSLISVMKKGLNEDSLQQKIKSLLFMNISWTLNHPDEYKFFKIFYTSPYAVNHILDQAASKFDFMVQIIEEGVRGGILKDIPNDLLINISGAMMMAISEYFLKNSPKFFDDCYKKMVFDLYWDLMKK